MSEALLKIQVETLDEGGYLATCEQLPGLIAQGRTLAETLEIAQDVARKLVESCLEHNDPLPEIFRSLVASSAELTIPVGLP